MASMPRPIRHRGVGAEKQKSSQVGRPFRRTRPRLVSTRVYEAGDTLRCPPAQEQGLGKQDRKRPPKRHSYVTAKYPACVAVAAHRFNVANPTRRSGTGSTPDKSPATKRLRVTST